jgi:uncharacterized protein YjbI with pentapeptide repeats
MRLPDWVGLNEKRWPKGDNEEFRPPKTLWDFLQLLVIPIALVGLAFALNAYQSDREAKREAARAARENRNAMRARAEDRATAREARLDDVLQSYLGRMSDLVLDRGLLRSQSGSNTQAVARTMTLAALRQLDATRKGHVIRFLHESNLIGGLLRSGSLTQGKVDLDGADLRGLDLRGEELTGYDLVGADLRGARFDGVFLTGVNMSYARVAKASFRGSWLHEVDFSNANLQGAIFDKAQVVNGVRFGDACLTDAKFRDADMKKAHFGQAIATNVDFTGAVVIGASLKNAVFLESKIGAAKKIVGGLPKGWTATGLTGEPFFHGCSI